eukprot:TRINITY_DN1637_c0_g1_i1.p1 TRINITY_DN1637_c0_g1~~TRINITY_DN1637_c0_g1_i1.p1  ORF type:complete len:717 (+),score=147.27 TRINITY_DN1637_c0_g1_i1:90-2153(+)
MKSLLILLITVQFVVVFSSTQLPIPGFRAPSYPLIVMSPYVSFWSNSDNLTDSNTTLWYNTNKPITGFLRVDGLPFRWASDPLAGDIAPATQVSVVAYPTRTVYTFNAAGVELVAEFFTPRFPEEEELLARPVSYITLNVSCIDGKKHDVEVYVDVTAELVVNDVGEQVVWNRYNSEGGLIAESIGAEKQDYLGNRGDFVDINWGYVYLAGDGKDKSMQQCINFANVTRGLFINKGVLPSDSSKQPVAVNVSYPVLAVSYAFTVAPHNTVSKVVLFTYDEMYSMYYFGEMLQPYWKHLYGTALNLLDAAWSQYKDLKKMGETVDTTLLNDAMTAGGAEYATMLALAYRQVLGSTTVVYNQEKKMSMYFLKEISSGGDIQTMDVIFPASPYFLYYNPSLLEALLLPLLEYANNETWHYYSREYAPHHLGTWPIANITTDEQENMPLEETANLILMIAGITLAKGEVPSYLPHYWKLIQSYGEFLLSVLPDPGNQLCTDDFEGPTPHDANLAAKGIVAVAAYATLCKYMGDPMCADSYNHVAQDFATDWMYLANRNESNHYVLRYDRYGWSLKYNLFYQTLLDLSVFPQSVFEMELDYYATEMMPFGVPLDVRSNFTKIDWQSWTATFAQDEATWNKFWTPLYKTAITTKQRVPLTDFYWTTNAQQVAFQARAVLGAFWAKMLLVQQGK